MIAASPSLKMELFESVMHIVYNKMQFRKKKSITSKQKLFAQKPVTVNPHINCRWGFMWFAVGTQVKILFTTK